jgi:hypothetical protein
MHCSSCQVASACNSNFYDGDVQGLAYRPLVLVRWRVDAMVDLWLW